MSRVQTTRTSTPTRPQRASSTVVFSAMMKPLTGLSAQFAHSHSHAMALTNTISHHSPPGSNLHGMHMGRAATVSGSPPLSRTPESHRSVFPFHPDQISVSSSSSTSSGQLHALSSHYGPPSQSTASLASQAQTRLRQPQRRSCIVLLRWFLTIRPLLELDQRRRWRACTGCQLMKIRRHIFTELLGDQRRLCRRLPRPASRA